MFKPSTIEDFVFNDDASKNQVLALVEGRIGVGDHGKTGLVLYGTYGTGKTTLAKLLPELIEKNRSPETCSSLFACSDSASCYTLTSCGLGENSTAVLQGIRSRRETSIWFATSGTQYEIIDEVDLLTAAAQASLKAMMTDMSRCLFIMTTNHLGKIDKGIRDRSYLVEMNAASPEAYLRVGRHIAETYGLDADVLPDDCLTALAHRARGSMRELGAAIAIYR